MAYESNSIFWIEVEKIVPNPFQPRREFDPQKLQELADSIRMYGVLQPLVVTRREIMREGGAFTTEYELIAGERRLRASKLAGLAQVPVIIRSGEETQLMKLELAIIENLQREDLNAVDRALAFKQLADAFGLSHTQVAQKVGRSREYVSNSIRLLQLPETILNALRVNDISDGHARTLLMLNDRPEEQDIVFREILLKKLSVREVERISRKIATEKVRKKEWLGSDPELIEIERQFTETLGTRVQISKTDFGGKLTIDYFAPEDLRKLLDIIHHAETQVGTDVKNVLAHIAAATPLQSDVPHAAVVDTEVQEPDVSDVLPEVPGEEVFTRHDTLYVPPPTPEELAEDEEMPPFAAAYQSFERAPVAEAPFVPAIPPVSPASVPRVEEVVTPVAPVAPVYAPTYPTPAAPAYATETENVYVVESVPKAPETQVMTPPTPAPQSAYAAPVPQVAPVIPQEETKKPAVASDDADLYSIRNFSI